MSSLKNFLLFCNWCLVLLFIGKGRCCGGLESRVEIFDEVWFLFLLRIDPCWRGWFSDSIKPQDLGLVTFEQNRGFGDLDGQGKRRPIMPRYAPPISYLHLYECDLFSV